MAGAIAADSDLYRRLPENFQRGEHKHLALRGRCDLLCGRAANRISVPVARGAHSHLCRQLARLPVRRAVWEVGLRLHVQCEHQADRHQQHVEHERQLPAVEAIDEVA
jgi:hypothetical protein